MVDNWKIAIGFLISLKYSCFIQSWGKYLMFDKLSARLHFHVLSLRRANRALLAVDRSTLEFEEDLLLLGDVRRRSQNSDIDLDFGESSLSVSLQRLMEHRFCPWSTSEEMEYGSRHWSTSGSEQMDSAIRQQACVS